MDIQVKAQPKSKEHWKRFVELYAKSGLTKIEFCRRHQINDKAFYSWCNRLRPDLKIINPDKKLVETSSANLFLPVRRPVATNNIKIKLQNGVELEFLSVPDAAWMANLIKDIGRNYVVTQ
jgi:transposase-like protein